ncbi:hypothetical protein DNTS_023088 [Danionella cerebrum]|uniref:Protein preY, mitochondrial n=1 Tax=Danionella cerebrum TaxID=2873325 RepID=A0A553QSL4_9TELE|nr:hypothetical protein DNTS_023088 [Danionella translucida]
MSYVLRAAVLRILTAQRSTSLPLLLHPRPVRHFGDAVKDSGSLPFDEALLEVLVCPLSKKPLRYDESSKELINEELGIAYPVIDGIPNMIPQDARMIPKNKEPEEPTES